MTVEKADSLYLKFFSLKYSEFLSRQIFPLKGKVIISNLEDGTVVHNPWLTVFPGKEQLWKLLKIQCDFLM